MTASSVVVNLILQRHHQVERIKIPSSRCGRGSQGTEHWRGVTGQGLEVAASGKQGLWALGSGPSVRGGRGCAERRLGAPGRSRPAGHQRLAGARVSRVLGWSGHVPGLR